jgi:dTDP-4-dehydrorhamnose 3,5-epimerase
MEIKKTNLHKQTPFRDIRVFKKKIFKDRRGVFSRIFCKNNFEKAGVKFQTKQINFSINAKKGTIRGLHYQDFKLKEAKVVTCLKGKIFDVIVDIRKNSKTYLKSFSIVLSDKNNLILYIPPGYAHGFQTIKNNVYILYLHNKFFDKKTYKTLNPLDKRVDIKWPISKKIISSKDKNKKNL